MILKVGMKTWSSNGMKKIKTHANIGDFIEVMIEPKQSKFFKIKRMFNKN